MWVVSVFVTGAVRPEAKEVLSDCNLLRKGGVIKEKTTTSFKHKKTLIWNTEKF
jgi:hypothetical protein